MHQSLDPVRVTGDAFRFLTRSVDTELSVCKRQIAFSAAHRARPGLKVPGGPRHSRDRAIWQPCLVSMRQMVPPPNWSLCSLVKRTISVADDRAPRSPMSGGDKKIGADGDGALEPFVGAQGAEGCVGLLVDVVLAGLMPRAWVTTIMCRT